MHRVHDLGRGRGHRHLRRLGYQGRLRRTADGPRRRAPKRVGERMKRRDEDRLTPNAGPIRRDYEDLWDGFARRLRDGETADPLGLGPGSMRRGVGAVLRLTNGVAASLEEVARILAGLVDEEVVPSGARDLHTTVHALEVRGDSEILNAAARRFVETALAVAPRHDRLCIRYEGLTVGPTGVLAQGWPAGEGLQDLRREMARRLGAQDLPAAAESGRVRRTRARHPACVRRAPQGPDAPGGFRGEQPGHGLRDGDLCLDGGGPLRRCGVEGQADPPGPDPARGPRSLRRGRAPVRQSPTKNAGGLARGLGRNDPRTRRTLYGEFVADRTATGKGGRLKQKWLKRTKPRAQARYRPADRYARPGGGLSLQPGVGVLDRGRPTLQAAAWRPRHKHRDLQRDFSWREQDRSPMPKGAPKHRSRRPPNSVPMREPPPLSILPRVPHPKARSTGWTSTGTQPQQSSLRRS